MSIQRTIENIKLEAGGPGSGRKPGFGTVSKKYVDDPRTKIGRGDVYPRNRYDKVKNQSVLSYLKQKGFKNTGMNQDATNTNATIWTKTTDDAGTEHAGHQSHTVMVYPNGEWEHTSESVHSGIGSGSLNEIHASSIELHASIGKMLDKISAGVRHGH